MKMRGFWNIGPCSLVEVDRRFRGAKCLHCQCDRCDEAVRISETSIYFKKSIQ
jgi:hypothetical protein